MEDASLIDVEIKFEKTFSICSIINNKEEYQLMKESFIQQGFEDDCEYLVADNSITNTFNAYQAIRRFLQEAKGAYIIIVHQDVRCNDSKLQLSNCIEDLQKKDSNWAICGNAGSDGYKRMFFHLNNNGDIKKSNRLPARVYSLDENLLIIKNAANLSISADLKDFHLYGTDLCIIADFLGYSCYVIEFMVTHLSKGNLGQLQKHVPAFLDAYSNKLRKRFVQTTCTKFFLSNNKRSTILFNSVPVFFFIKAWQRIKNNFSK